MSEYPLLKNAPIVEAVLDIQAKLPSEFEIGKFDYIHQSFKNQYPKREELRKFEGKIEFEKGAPTSSVSEKMGGYRYLSDDGKQVVQLRIDGFTFSRLTPYINWEQLRDEAYRLWILYKEVASPLITRVALRYINKLNIPMSINLGDYLTAPPIVPAELPQFVNSFLTRIIIYEPIIPANAIITQVFEPSPTPNIAQIILDIDVFKLKPEGIEDKDAWETLEKLRHFKNKVFFNSITDKLKEIYK